LRTSLNSAITLYSESHAQPIRASKHRLHHRPPTRTSRGERSSRQALAPAPVPDSTTYTGLPCFYLSNIQNPALHCLKLQPASLLAIGGRLVDHFWDEAEVSQKVNKSSKLNNIELRKTK